jgi:hypothetical protein
VSLLYASERVQFNSAAPSCDCLAHVYGNAADHPDRELRYPSGMSDAEWAAPCHEHQDRHHQPHMRRSSESRISGRGS